VSAGPSQKVGQKVTNRTRQLPKGSTYSPRQRQAKNRSEKEPQLVFNLHAPLKQTSPCEISLSQHQATLKNRGQKESSKQKEVIMYLSKSSSNNSFELVNGG
jgi:hypothetical protein